MTLVIFNKQGLLIKKFIITQKFAIITQKLIWLSTQLFRIHFYTIWGKISAYC